MKLTQEELDAKMAGYQIELSDSISDTYKKIIEYKQTACGIEYKVECLLCGKRCKQVNPYKGHVRFKCNECNIPILKAIEKMTEGKE